MYIHRQLKAIRNFPVTAVTRPRQCGKSTLVKNIPDTYSESIIRNLLTEADGVQNLTLIY
jgi:predicted AAA+ superfamily ATPase